MNKRKKLLKEKKLMVTAAVIFSALIAISIFLFQTDKKKIKEENSISRITEEYKSNQNTANGIKGADFRVRDEEGKVIEERLGTYDTTDKEKGNNDKLKKKGEDFVYNFVKILNNKDYDTLYSLFNKDYIEGFNFTKDKLKSSFSFNGEVSAEVTKVEENESKDRIIITTKFTEKSTGYLKIVDFTLFKDGTISDIPIYITSNLNKVKEIGNVIYKINTRYETRLGSIYSVEIINNSDRLIDVEDMILKKNDTIYSYEIISDNTIIKSYPGIPFKFLMKVPNNNSLTNVILKCRNIDGGIDEITILDE